MLDDLRQQADSGFLDESAAEQDAYAAPVRAQRPSNFLGMSPFQRFFVAALLLGIICLVSILCLLVTQKVVPPFLY
jgi:hypothetical protein